MQPEPDPGLSVPFKGRDIVCVQGTGLGPGVHLGFDAGIGKVGQRDPLPPTDKLLFSGGHAYSSKDSEPDLPGMIGCGFYLAQVSR